MSEHEVVQVYLAEQQLQAHFLCNLLGDAGIEARVVGENLDLVGPPANVQSGAVWVRRQDAERAREILEAWERRSRASARSDE